jgi:DNA-binding NtrC family response regulator
MAQAMKIAIIDDEQDMRQSISQWLALSGFETETFASAGDALKGLSADYPGIIVTDIKMPGMDGMQFLRKVKGIDSNLPVIMITGHGDVPMAVEAMRMGAFDFLEKPFNPDTMTDLAKKATRARRLVLDNRQLRRELSSGSSIMEKLLALMGLWSDCARIFWISGKRMAMYSSRAKPVRVKLSWPMRCMRFPQGPARNLFSFLARARRKRPSCGAYLVLRVKKIACRS